MATAPNTGGKQEIGAPVDNFTLAALHGAQTSLQDVLAGKKGAVVVFWSSVCSHCVRYDPYLNGFAERHPDIGLVAVACRYGETAEQIREAIKERQISFPVLHDPNSKLAQQWRTQQTPRAFLLDANRNLLYRGAIDNFKYPADPQFVPHLDPAIAEFVAGQPVTRIETASFGCAVTSVYYLLPATLKS